MMRGGGEHKRVWLFLLFSIMEIMSWVSSAAGTPFPHGTQAQVPHSFQVKWAATTKVRERVLEEGKVHGDGFRGLGTLGSRPPSCEHKCGECAPCAAIQVPTNTDHLRTQYANYEPEGWKCKCGSSFFNP